MKKFRKPLSILLAAIMALSACVVGFTAFAADGSRDLSTPEGIQEAILSDFNNTSPKLQDDVKAAYVALDEGQKDSISAAATSRVFRMSYNSASGSGATKVAASVTALGGYTAKQEKAINTALMFAGYGDYDIGGTVYKAVSLVNFPFTKDYTASGVTYTVADQKAIVEYMMGLYKEAGADGTLELIENVYAYSKYQYFYGSVYGAAVDKILRATVTYVQALNPGMDAAAVEAQVINLLGLTDSGTFNVLGTIYKYTSNTLTDALAAYNTSDKGTDAAAAYKAIVKPYYDAANISYTLDSKIANNTAKIINVNGELKSVSDIWSPVKDAYAEILDNEAIMGVVEKLALLDYANIKNSADVQTAFVDSGYTKLAYGQKTKLAQNQGKTYYDKLIKIAYDADTKEFRDAVTNYKIPTEVTDANKDTVAKDISVITGLYNGLKSNLSAVSSSTSTLQTYIKNTYSSVQDKFTKIQNLQYDINIIDLVAAVKAFDLEAAAGTDLNEKIDAVKAMYNALDNNTVTYFKNNQSEIYNKYNKIMAKYVVQPGEEDTHELFDPEVIAAEMTAPLESVVYDTIIPKISGLINTLLPALMGSDVTNIQGAVDSLFTNESVTAVVIMINQAIYGALEGMDPVMGMPVPTLFALTPSKVAEVLPDTYANAKAVLATLGDTKEAWNQVPADLDWGVTPGNYEQFIDALLKGISGLTISLGGSLAVGPILKKALVGSYSELPDGSGIDPATLTPGGWDYFIIPLLEVLNVPQDKIPTNVEYADQIVKDEAVTTTNILKPLIDTLYYQVLPQLSADPVDYLLSILPNLAYHLEDGCLIDGLNKIIDNLNVTIIFNTTIDLKPMIMGLFKENEDDPAPESLSLELIWSKISPLLSGAGLNISLEDVLKVGRLGTPERVDTVRAGVASTVKVTADKDSVLNYLLNAVNGLIDGLGVDFSVNGEFVKQEAPKYPHDGKMNKDVMNAMVTGLDGLLGGFVNINDLINNNLCTNIMAADAITAIYSALEGVFGDVLSPSVVALFLLEDNYKDIVAALQVPTWADVSLVVKNGDKVYSSTDMGFKDGDRDGFINCLVAALRPLAGAIGETGLLINTTAADGSTAYGLYETLIIPTFEALGITPAVDSATYTSNYNKLAMRTDPTTAYDYQIKTILDPILDLVNDVAAAPAATLMKLLPNLAYAIQYNPQLAFVGNLLDGMGGLTGLLNGLIQGIQTGTDDAGNAVYGLKDLVLPEIPLDALASAGKVTEKASKSALHETYTTVVPDTADAFVTVFYYLYDAINYNDNLNTIKGLIDGIDGIDETMSTMISTILNDVFTLSKEDALCALGELLASDVWECPNADGNDGSKTPSTGDYGVPAAVVLLMMVSAGGAILLLKKKKPVAVK